MASYSELFTLRSNADLRNRITSAIAVKCDEIRVENVNTANHDNRLLWAKEALSNPEAMAEKMMWGILAANRTATASVIEGATDAQILTAVDNLVNIYATTPVPA